MLIFEITLGATLALKLPQGELCKHSALRHVHDDRERKGGSGERDTKSGPKNSNEIRFYSDSLIHIVFMISNLTDNAKDQKVLHTRI